MAGYELRWVGAAQTPTFDKRALMLTSVGYSHTSFYPILTILSRNWLCLGALDYWYQPRAGSAVLLNSGEPLPAILLDPAALTLSWPESHSHPLTFFYLDTILAQKCQ